MLYGNLPYFFQHIFVMLLDVHTKKCARVPFTNQKYSFFHIFRENLLINIRVGHQDDFSSINCEKPVVSDDPPLLMVGFSIHTD